MNDMTPYKPRSRPNPYLGHVINAGKWASLPSEAGEYTERGTLRSQAVPSNHYPSKIKNKKRT